ncbi:hypothetical protein Shel_22820 [Slackia heliotrinireducens DSM 20476]|uniref:Uncharacterized protein n=1 Tax=Slackia heliotrinireducens (strain ATCC 29202 / DSM 20476 / NCTC 11029 / RHS 1) TaxID=471855 RepID=C7N170_SLAHD|nr:hypothetical protein Shel_22820 [Slackia heliotrinireducens DSM 20476]
MLARRLRQGYYSFLGKRLMRQAIICKTQADHMGLVHGFRMSETVGN